MSLTDDRTPLAAYLSVSLVELPGAGHMGLLSHSQRVSELILAHIASAAVADGRVRGR